MASSSRISILSSLFDVGTPKSSERILLSIPITSHPFSLKKSTASEPTRPRLPVIQTFFFILLNNNPTLTLWILCSLNSISIILRWRYYFFIFIWIQKCRPDRESGVCHNMPFTACHSVQVVNLALTLPKLKLYSLAGQPLINPFPILIVISSLSISVKNKELLPRKVI